MDLVDAQQTRRILIVWLDTDHLILWKKVRSRLSAGRVQSVALRLVVEREREIDAFDPVEYWSIDADLLPEGGQVAYRFRLVKINGDDPQLGNQALVEPILLTCARQHIRLKPSSTENATEPTAAFYHQHITAGCLSQTGIHGS